MVIGSGGREHALIRSLTQSKQVDKIYALPGNGGIAELAECVPISAMDLDAIVDFATANAVDFAVVAPDDPLVAGLVDRLESAGVPTFGPNKDAAIIEGSKSFAKDLMKRYDIPTAGYEVFTDESAALRFVGERDEFPVVIKADGLALGKGVIIAQDKAEAQSAIRQMMSENAFGSAGQTVVVEDFLTGPEVSMLVFTDGKTVRPMVSSMDHKRVYDNDEGPNTGGMGVVAPNLYYTDSVAQEVLETIIEPTVAAMAKENRPFRGCLYFGLMLTDAGPRVIEYNCRFGDPEAQAVLPLLRSDLLTIMQACRDGVLDQVEVDFSGDASCCLVLASGGYPTEYTTGASIEIGDLSADCYVYHAGTKRTDDGDLVTAGGRVLGVTATAPTLEGAIEEAYRAISDVTFANSHFRNDIGARALAALVNKEQF